MRKIIIYTSFLIVLTLSSMDIFAQQYSVCESGANYVEMQQTCNNVPGEFEAREKISLMPNFRFNKNDGGNQVFSIKLNETLVLDLESTPEINVPDIEDIEIDASLAVGSIAGMYGVSGTGAATYTVPIGVPKGVAGLEPSISINYTSQSGNGLLGWGWHLAGTSSVVRVPQNEYYDDNITAIQLTNEDRFMLDGVRLLPKNSSNYTGYGANDFLYEKEVTDFSTIKSISNTNGPQCFIVTTKDGIIIEYGVTADSRLLTSGNKILAWNINKITDRNGNYIKFTYDNSNKECVISHIEYTGNINAGQEPTNKITFVYDKRSVDKNLMYISDGQYIKSEKILTKIIVRSNNSVLAKYEFEYFNDDVFTKLYKIRQFGINDEEINSTFVNWGEKGGFLNRNCMFQSNSSISNASPYAQYIIADFTGNGRSDIIYHDFLFDENNQPIEKIFELYSTTHHSSVAESYIDYNIIASNEININYDIGGRYSSNINVSKSNYYIVSDYNGDMKNDLLVLEKQSHQNENFEYLHSFKIYSKANNSFSIIQDFNFIGRTGITYDDLVTRKNDNDFVIGDFTGDGTTNLLIFFFDYGMASDGFTGTTCVYNNKFKPMLCCPATDSYFSLSESQEDICYYERSLVPTEGGSNKIFAIDFTGDGKDEIIVLNENMAMIFKIDILNNNTFQIVNIHNTYSLTRNNEIHGFGDFNGDGKSDILFDNGKIAYSNGDGFIIENPVFEIDLYEICDIKPEFIIGDFNGDGKTDLTIVSLHREQIQSLEFHWFLKFNVFYSTGLNDVGLILGDSYISDDYILSSGTPCATEVFGSLHIILKQFLKNNYVGDFSGNGKADIFNSKTMRVYSFNTNKEENHVTNIKDGFENLLEFEYSVTPDQYTNLGYNEGDFGSDYRIVNFPIVVTSAVIHENAYYDGTIYDQNLIAKYNYRGSLFYKPKKSWVGYHKNINSSGFRSDQFSWNFPIISETINETQYDGLLMPTYSKTEITNELIGEKYFEYNSLTPNINNSKIIFPYQNQIIEKQYTGPSYTSSTTINNINNLGNLYYSKTTTENNIDDNKIIVETDYVYVGAGDITTPHKPELISTKTSYQNFNETVPEDDFETEVHYEYYPNGNLKKQTDNKTNIYTLYEDYNHFGLPKKITSIVPEKTPRTKNFVYSQCGRFVLKETDDMGLSVEYIYHPSTNNLVSTTDIYGHITSFKYDNLNRLIETTNPFGIKSKRTYEWVLNSDIDNAVYKITTNAPNQPEQISYFDKLSRNIRNESKGYQNRTVAVDSHYDKWGNLHKKSEPYFDNDNPVYVVNEYYEDGYKFNKIFKQTSRGLSTQYEYLFNSGWTTYPSGNTYFSKYDIAGNIIKSTYPANNEVEFKYYSHLQPKSINANGVETITDYNDFAYQTGLTDKNAGTIEYDYFVDGMLKDQSDARGMEIALQYDQFDRIEKMILDSGDGEIEYNYYTDGNAKAMLKSISAPVNETQYEYDSYQRLVKLSENIDNTVYEFEYIYDNKGNLIKEIYPNNFGIIYEYDNNGLLTGVKELTTNQDIWSTTDYNALGQVGDIYLRNNNRIKYTYDSQTGLLNNIAFGDQTQSFGISYNFNAATGNLDSRTCTKHNIVENFTYDNLNRLRTYTVEQNSNIEEFEVNYYDNGNISEKSDVGQYIYDDTDQPHAVKVILPFEMEGGQYEHNPLLDQDIQYNSYNKATKITQGDYELEIFYGHDKERRKTILKDGENNVYTRYYLGKYEKEINHTTNITTEYYYVGGPMGNIAVYISENGAEPELYYTITDHLGSIVAVADEDGEILEEQRYDPWGNYRNPLTGEPEETPQLTMLYRGYTGHEMLPEFGLINMNGRLYDPVIARVLSPDNYVQNPYNPQNYNRYSYCYNNPLVYVDPDGDNPFLISMLFGIASGGYSGYQIGIAQGARGSELFGYTLMGGIIGGLSGFIGGGVGGAIAGANFPCASAVGAITGGAISGTISGGGFASLSGDNVGQGALYGAISSASGSFVSGAVGGAPGAFFGGATAGSVGTALRGDSPEERQRSAILGGIFGLCSYEISNYYNYKTSYSGELNYWGYHKANAAFARANFWEAEASWYETADGNVRKIRYGLPFSHKVQTAKNPPSNTVYQSHTHTRSGKGYQFYGPTDLASYCNELNRGYDFRVYGYKDCYTINRATVELLQGSLTEFGKFDAHGFYFSNRNTVANYGIWATQQGITDGSRHGLSLYFHNIFWYGW